MRVVKNLIAGFILGLTGLATAQQPQTSNLPPLTPPFAVNAKYVNGVAPGFDPTGDGVTLTLTIGKGTSFCGSTIQNYSGGTLTMTASATNYVYLDTTNSCVPTKSTAAFTSTQIPIAVVVTGSTAITSITDDRNFFNNASGGVLPTGCSAVTQSGVGNLTCTGTVIGNGLVGGVNGGFSTLVGTATTPALKQDLRLVTDVSITANTGVITSATANFTSADNSRIAIINPKDALNVVTLNTAGTGWNPNDRCAVAGGTGGQVIILATTAGVPTRVETVQSGYGYSAATGAVCSAVSPATGTGLTINTTVNLGARSYTGYLTVTNSTTATLSLPYGGANSTNASMIIGTDDGPALNNLLQTIASDGAQGDLSLGCKPIITSVTIYLGLSKNTNIKGCGQASGVTSGLLAGKAIGTTIIWAGASHPVTTASISSGHTVVLTDPLGHGFSSPSNCASSPRQCAVDLEGCSQTGLNGMHMIVTPVSSSTLLSFYTAGTVFSADSCFIPSNTTGDIIKLDSEWGTTIENINIQGSDQPATYPRACIDMVDGAGSTTNGLNKVSGVFCGNLGEQGFALPGNKYADTSVAQFGILADPLSGVNDKNNFENVSFYNVGACIAAEHQQPQDWTFSGTTYCSFSGMGFFLPDGNWWHVSGTVQDLQNGQDYVLGNFSHLDVAKSTEETDGPAFVSGIQMGGPGDAIGSSMMAEFISPSGTGLPGGILAIDHGVYPATGALPSNGDFIWTSPGTSAAIFLNDFTLKTGVLSTPLVTPIVDLTASGSQKNIFDCEHCGGFNNNNFNVTSTGNQNQLTVVCLNQPNGPGIGGNGCNWLVHGDAAGVDDFRTDLMKIRSLGGQVLIPQLGIPVAPSNPVCAVSGSTTYYYKFTAVSGGLESLPSSEFTASSCASSVNSTNYIQGIVWSVAGADSYKIYRGTSSNGELYAFTLQANTGYNTNLNPSGGTPFTFQDTVTTPSGALPTVNSTGEAQFTYFLPTLSTVPIGNACPVNGAMWFGLDSSVGQCESNVIVVWPSVASPPAYVLTAGAGAGTGGSVGVVCLNSSFERCTTWGGTVILTTGASGMAIGNQVVFTYTNPSGYVHPCTFTPTNALTYNLGTYYTVISATQFAVSTAIAPGAGASLGWTYSCPVAP